MATINPTITRNNDFTVIKYTYSALGTGDDGAPFKAPEFADKTVQVTGTPGTTAGTINVQGSNDENNYFTLTEPGGVTALGTVAVTEGNAIQENPLTIRPLVVAGDGATDLEVTFACRRPTDKRQ